MSERYEIIGPGSNPPEKRNVAAYLDGYREGAGQLIEGELEKTPGEEKAIVLVGDLLKREFIDLGIDDRTPEISMDRFHVMPGNWFDHNEGKNTVGSYSVLGDKAMLSRERAGTPVEMYKVIFHEAIHAAGKQKHWVNGKKVQTYRSGYRTNNQFDPRNQHEHLRGLNEGVVEMTAQMLFYRYQHEIERALGVTAEQVREKGFSYDISRSVVQEICEAIAAYEETGPNEVWRRMKRGQFTGEMMHPRDIEQVYDKGALRVLDALIVNPDDDLIESERKKIDERNTKVLEYFKKRDVGGKDLGTERAAIARAVLGKEDFERYCM